MGAFTASFAAALVILQATLIFLSRSELQWSFYLVQRVQSLPDWSSLLLDTASPQQPLADQHNNNNDSSSLIIRHHNDNVMMIAHHARSDLESPFTRCLIDAQDRSIASAKHPSSSSSLLLPPVVVHHTDHNFNPEKKCSEWTSHTSQRADPVLAPFNPHLILLAIACIHCLLCLSRVYKNNDKKPTTTTTSRHQSGSRSGGSATVVEEGMNDNMINATAATGDEASFLPSSTQRQTSNYSLKEVAPIKWVLAGMSILVLIAAVLSAVSSPDLLRYTTILVVVGIFLCGCVFVCLFDTCKEDLDWTLAFHLQVVGVPLTVHMLSAMGVRFWVDVLAHSTLLSAAVNCLWLQSTLKDQPLQIARFATVAIPTFCIAFTQQEWGVDSWQHVVAIMAALSLAPLYILTVMRPMQEETGKAKSQRLRITHLCTSGAVLSAIVNLAML